MNHTMVLIDRHQLAQLLSQASKVEVLTHQLRESHSDSHDGSPPIYLTPREIEILDFVREGLTNKEIANRLGGDITERTIKFHIHNLLLKFKVRRRSHLIHAAELRFPKLQPA